MCSLFNEVLRYSNCKNSIVLPESDCVLGVRSAEILLHL